MDDLDFTSWLKDVFADDILAARILVNPEFECRNAGLTEAQTELILKVVQSAPDSVKSRAKEFLNLL